MLLYVIILNLTYNMRLNIIFTYPNENKRDNRAGYNRSRLIVD